MKKGLILLLIIAILAPIMLTGCTNQSIKKIVFDDSTKDSLMKSFAEKTIEITDIEGMAYFYVDADYVQLVDVDGKPITYEKGKSHNLLIQDVNIVDDDPAITEITYIIEDTETGVKWFSCHKIAGIRSFLEIVVIYESDTSVIIGENGLPKVD